MRIGKFNGRRLVVRRTNEEWLLKGCLEKAKLSGIPRIWCNDGGTVANKYGYPAETEALLTCAFPDGRWLQILTRIPANKATYSGVASACCRFAEAPDIHPCFDERYGRDKKDAARAAFIAWAQELIPVTPATDPTAVMIETSTITDPVAIQLAS